jgi:hypothetical protein
MTTVADILRVAEDARANRLVYREPNGYVSIQQAPPYDAASGNDRFGTSFVHHCGIAVAFIYTRAGLRFGIDYPSWIQHSITVARQMFNEGFATDEPQAGGIGVMDWGAGGFGMAATQYADHVVLIVEPRPRTIVVMDANTSDVPDGRLVYHEYPREWFVAWGMPKNLTTAPDPAPAVVASILAINAAKAQEDSMPLIVDLTDASGAVVGHRAYVPTRGWREPSTDQLTEANGWTRFECPLSEWDRWGLESLADVNTMTDAVVARAIAQLKQ